MNLYAYAMNSPVNYLDPFGWQPKDKYYGRPKSFWKWYHKNAKEKGDPDLDKDQADWWRHRWDAEGKPDVDGSPTCEPDPNPEEPEPYPDGTPDPAPDRADFAPLSDDEATAIGITGTVIGVIVTIVLAPLGVGS